MYLRPAVGEYGSEKWQSRSCSALCGAIWLLNTVILCQASALGRPSAGHQVPDTMAHSAPRSIAKVLEKALGNGSHWNTNATNMLCALQQCARVCVRSGIPGPKARGFYRHLQDIRTPKNVKHTTDRIHVKTIPPRLTCQREQLLQQFLTASLHVHYDCVRYVPSRMIYVQALATGGFHRHMKGHETG